MLVDSFGRNINYLRLAVTDRCNLRCFYCMPANGIRYINRKDLLSFEEMYRMVKMLSHQGVNKLRITGGEPFLRKGIMEFLQEVSKIEGIDQINVTTNGTFTKDKVRALEEMGIHSINLSLDSLDADSGFCRLVMDGKKAFIYAFTYTEDEPCLSAIKRAGKSDYLMGK